MKQSVKVSVARHNFFRSSGHGTLRFTESSPDGSWEPSFECGCTKNAHEKPEGEPDSTNTIIRIKEEADCRTSRTREFGFEVAGRSERDDSSARFESMWDKSSVKFEFLWDKTKADKEKETDTSPFTNKDRPRACFWFQNDHVKIEVYKPGYGSTNCFLTDLYLGNKVDTSKLLRGAQKSKVVNLRKVGPESLWCYDSSWGDPGESWEILPEGDETECWRRVCKNVEEIGAISSDLMTSGVAKIRESVENNHRFMDKVRDTQQWLTIVLNSLDSTEVFKASDKILRAIRPPRDPVSEAVAKYMNRQSTDDSEMRT